MTKKNVMAIILSAFVICMTCSSYCWVFVLYFYYSISILLLLPFILSCLINNIAFNVELRDCKQSFLYHGRNLYITNISHYTCYKFEVFNNNVSNTNHSLPISGIAYTLDGDFHQKTLPTKSTTCPAPRLIRSN